MGEFRMPSLGSDMEAGTLVLWNVTPGDHVGRGDIIAEVETHKGIIEVEVWETGVIEEIMVEAGEEVPVGTPLAFIRTEAEERVPAPAGIEEAPREREPAPAEHERVPVTENGRRVRVSPVARKLAADLGVDLADVEGTGPRGAIQRADIERAAEEMKAADAKAKAEAAEKERGAKPAPAPEAAPRKPNIASEAFQAGIRQAIAAAMARSNREIPHYYLETRIDMSHALDWLEAQNEERSIKDRILPVVLLIKATAMALTDVPELNAYWRDDEHQIQEAIHIGFAISLRQGGLVTPALHHVDLKSLDEVMADLRDLIMRTRAGRLRSSEMSDATITLTSLGDMGVETVHGVIYPPQVALVGFGKTMEQPWVENGMIGVRRIVTATLAADHRATDGHRGGQFLTALDRYLQEVESL